MYSDTPKRRTGWLLPLIVLVFAGLIAVLLAVKKPGRDVSEESSVAIAEAVRRSALQCYAVEGVYPPNLAYLEDNYGLQVNTEDFYVTYESFASNLPPTVKVVAKN